MAPVSEKVDERILRLLGLEFVFDLDYATYITLLNEAIVSGKNKLPQEELALLSNEKKRIRNKKGRFKPQKQKITADKFATTKFLKPTVQPISSPVVPAQVQTPPQPINLSPLEGPLESIKSTLQEFLKFRKSSEEQERRSYEAAKRAKREAVLENVQKGMSAVSNAVKTFISPFQGIVDRIWRFIFFTLLGNAFNQLINWFSDPNNQKKVKTLQRFLKDWWPALLGAVVIFFTPFGRFVRGVLRIVGGFTGKLVGLIPKIGGAINSLRRVLMRNPLLAGLAVGGAAVGATIAYFNQQQAKEEGNQEVAESQQQVQQFSSGGSILKSLFGFNQAQRNPYAQMFGYGGITSNTGQVITGFGPDTQLIAAQPGEIVINKKTVDAVGSDTLLNLNRYYGGPGANQPKMGRLFNTGGEVPKYGQNLKYRSPIPGYPNYQQPKDKYGEFYAKIYRLAKAYGDPFPEVTAAQAAEESGYGSSHLAKKANNLFGQDAPSGSQGYKYIDPIEKKEHNAMMFKSIADSVAYRVRTWKKYYGDAKTPEQAIINISKSGYNPHSSYPTKIISLLREQGVEPSLPSPLRVTSVTKPKPKEDKEKQKEQVQGRPWYDPFGWFGGAAAVQKKQGGGIFDVTEKTGLKIPPSSFFGVDTQFVPLALQPGEKGFILPKKAVEKGAVPAFENLLANIDPTSNSAKGLNYRADPKVPEIKPLSGGKSEVMNLPDITQSASLPSGGRGGGGGSQVPPFSAISPKSLRTMNLSIYGVVGA